MLILLSKSSSSKGKKRLVRLYERFLELGGLAYLPFFRPRESRLQQVALLLTDAHRRRTILARKSSWTSVDAPMVRTVQLHCKPLYRLCVPLLSLLWLSLRVVAYTCVHRPEWSRSSSSRRPSQHCIYSRTAAFSLLSPTSSKMVPPFSISEASGKEQSQLLDGAELNSVVSASREWRPSCARSS
jgi:hypothetical protein